MLIIIQIDLEKFDVIRGRSVRVSEFASAETFYVSQPSVASSEECASQCLQYGPGCGSFQYVMDPDVDPSRPLCSLHTPSYGCLARTGGALVVDVAVAYYTLSNASLHCNGSEFSHVRY